MAEQPRSRDGERQAEPQPVQSLEDVNLHEARTRVEQAPIHQLASLHREEQQGEARPQVMAAIQRRRDRLQSGDGQPTHGIEELGALAPRRWRCAPAVARAALMELGVTALTLEQADQLVPAFRDRPAPIPVTEGR